MKRVEVKRLENESYLDWYKRNRLSHNLKCNYCGGDASDNERNYIPDPYCPNVVCKEHDYMAFTGRINKSIPEIEDTKNKKYLELLEEFSKGKELIHPMYGKVLKMENLDKFGRGFITFERNPNLPHESNPFNIKVKE